MTCSNVFRWMILPALLLTVGSMVGCATNPRLRARAQESLEKGQIEEAAMNLERAVHQDATDWRAQAMLGDVRIKQGRFLDAEMLLDQAASLVPDFYGSARPAIYDSQAEAIYRQGRNDGLAQFVKRIASERQTTRDYLRAAKYLGLIHDVDGSNLALRKAAKMAGKNDAEPYLAMAEYYEQIGDEGRAVAALKNALFIAPASVEIANRLRRHGIVPGPTTAVPPEE